MDFASALTEDARLRILQILAKETDYRLADRMLVYHLEAWGHRPAVNAVRTQLRVMEKLGAVRLVEDREDIVIAEITSAGLDHVKRRRGGVPIDGIRRPEPGE